jgi:hypothetical protein
MSSLYERVEAKSSLRADLAQRRLWSRRIRATKFGLLSFSWSYLPLVEELQISLLMQWVMLGNL